MQQKTTVEHVLHYIGRKLRKDADGNEVISRHHAELAARMAFEGGRQSVVENIPELEWDCFEATTEIGTFSISKFLNSFYFSLDDMKHWKYFDNIEDTMLAANEYYKKRIKQALGL